MEIRTTELAGLLVIEPKVFCDSRGYFFESWSKARYEEAGIACNFVQDNESRSSYGVVRGLHWQAAPYAQAKLLRVVLGTILDVAVDIRRGSPTFGRHLALELSCENKRQLFIPKGFAHGFAVLSPEALLLYKCDAPYAPKAERGMRCDDPALGIDWRVPPERWIRSERDLRHPLLKDIEPLEGCP